jgi:hypothetical protein
MRTGRAISAAMPSLDDDVSRLTREKPEAVMSRLASRISVAATDKRQLMDPTGHAKFHFKSQDGHTIDFERSGPPGAPDTLSTLKRDGVTIGSLATSWIEVADGWVAKQVRDRLPLEGGGAIEATLDLSDWRVSPHWADEAPDGFTIVQSSAALCAAEDVEEGHCYWDFDEGGWINQAEFESKCSVLRFAASLASTYADEAIAAKVAFHYDVHVPVCASGLPFVCDIAYNLCMNLTDAMNGAVATEADCWRAFYNMGCGNY